MTKPADHRLIFYCPDYDNRKYEADGIFPISMPVLFAKYNLLEAWVTVNGDEWEGVGLLNSGSYMQTVLYVFQVLHVLFS